MTEPKTPKMTDEEKKLLLTRVLESGEGLKFLMDIIADPRSRVNFKIDIEVTRIPVKE